MMNKGTFGTLFSGGELFGMGAMEAGLTHSWGVEIRDDVAQVANANLEPFGSQVHKTDILALWHKMLEPVDLIHASPPCPNFSRPQRHGVQDESWEDVSLAHKIVEVVQDLGPKHFTLENVWEYRRSESILIIMNSLREMGYYATYGQKDAADYGVPQKRRRLILRASRIGMPNRMIQERHIGWFKAIEDLVPTLEPDTFAKFQLDRMGPEAHEAMNLPAMADPGWRKFYIPGSNSASARPVLSWEPAKTVNDTQRVNAHRACINGQVYRLSTRCLARWQTMPDSYLLPENRQLARFIVGNGVPCKLARKMVESLPEEES